MKLVCHEASSDSRTTWKGISCGFKGVGDWRVWRRGYTVAWWMRCSSLLLGLSVLRM